MNLVALLPGHVLMSYFKLCFLMVPQLLDLCMLDVRGLEFSNGVLAASALFHFSSLELVENVSGKTAATLPGKE